jgi:tight adherence protein C
VLILLLGLVFVGIAAISLANALAGGRAKRHDRLASIAAYGFSAGAATPALARRSGLRDVLEKLANRLGDILNSRLDSERQNEMRRMLYAAGLYNTTSRQFLGYRALATLGLALFWLWVVVVGGHTSPAVAILGLFIAAAVGWVGPSFAVKRRATMRHDQIDYELPELVDLLVTAVEGGVAFTSSLQLASRSFEGPLGEELRLALQEHTMGLSTSQALSNMLTRIDTPAMRAFVQAVVQGESLGVSIGKTLRDLASEMRSRRRYAAQERAHKAGTKILFPIALLIFPSLFVIVLGSVLLSITSSLNGG